jgi:HlyD family secretion protein
MRITRLTPLPLSSTALMLTVGAVLLAACQAPGGQPAVDAAATQVPRATRTALPTRAVLPVFNVTANGVLALRGPVAQAGFDVSGKINSVRVLVGQRVKPGDVLATIDDADLRDAIEDAEVTLALTDAQIRQQAAPIAQEDIAAAKAALASASASYAQTKTGTAQGDIANAQRNVDAAWLQYLAAQTSRDVHCGGQFGTAAIDCKQKEVQFGNAYESWLSARATLQGLQDPVSKNALTQAYSPLASAQAKLDALNAPTTAESKKIAELQHEQAKAALERARSKLGKATLSAPCDCIVQEVKVAVGGAANAAAFVLVDAARLQFQTTNLTERDLNGVGPGAQANIRLKAHVTPLTGKVATVLSQSSGAQDGVALFTVLIDIDATDKLLLPGMTGEVELALKR